LSFKDSRLDKFNGYVVLPTPPSTPKTLIKSDCYSLTLKSGKSNGKFKRNY